MAEPTLDELISRFEASSQGAETAPGWSYVSLGVVATTVLVLVIVAHRTRHIWAPRHGNKVSEGRHRIGIGCAAPLAILVVFFGAGAAIADHGLILGPLAAILTGVAVFLIPYVLLRLLGWIVEGFVSGGKPS
jgi:hypothetical protein